jgi:hypothetical protein
MDVGPYITKEKAAAEQGSETPATKLGIVFNLPPCHKG